MLIVEVNEGWVGGSVIAFQVLQQHKALEDLKQVGESMALLVGARDSNKGLVFLSQTLLRVIEFTLLLFCTFVVLILIKYESTGNSG